MNRDDLSFLKQFGYAKFPRILQIEITKDCPFSCPQCYKPSSDSCHMDFDRLKNLLSAIENKCKGISFNGGEPMVYPYIYDLLNFIQGKNFDVYVYSSGYGVDKNFCSTIKRNSRLNYYISLNGSTKEINDLSRQGYSVAIQAMETMTESGVDYGIVWVARHDNVNDFPNIIDLARYYNISHIAVISNRLTGEGIIDSPLDGDDLTKLASIIKGKEACEPYIWVDNCFSDLIVALGNHMKGLPMRCLAGINRCTVNYDFSFQPCTHLHYAEKFESLEDYWNDSETLRTLRTHQYSDGGLCRLCLNKKRCFPCRAANKDLYEHIETYVSKCMNFSCDRRK